MRIVECFLRGKKLEPSQCEDGFIMTEDYAAVIDGATAKSDLTVDGRSTGRYIMELIKYSIENIPSDLDSVTFINLIENQILNSYKNDGVYEIIMSEPHSVPKASMIVYSKSRREFWLFGDAHGMMDGVHVENKKYIDDITSAVRRLVNEYHIINGKTEEELLLEDEGAKAIKTLLLMQCSFTNSKFDSPFSYACITGFGINESQIKVVSVSQDTENIILASDGYTKLFMTLEETESYLKEMNTRDPLGIKENVTVKGIYAGFRSFDDRAYLKIKL